MFYAVLPVVLGLVLASLIAHSRVRGVTFFRAALFLPQTIATVVVAIAWVWIYAPEGPLNEALRAVGLGSLARGWLGDFSLALPALGLVGTWVMFGLCLVLFLAGIQKVPVSLYEAARVDGAGRVREFFAVTLPGLRGELAVALTLTTITALRTFDLIYVSTSGGPGTATTVPSVLVYQNAFSNGRVGLAAAVAVVLTALIFVVAFGIIRLVERDPIDDGRPPRAVAQLRRARRVRGGRALPDPEHPAAGVPRALGRRHRLLDPPLPRLQRVQPGVGRGRLRPRPAQQLHRRRHRHGRLRGARPRLPATRSARCASAARTRCSTCC